jgi:plasmid maintenance system antidote protein VapI
MIPTMVEEQEGEDGYAERLAQAMKHAQVDNKMLAEALDVHTNAIKKVLAGQSKAFSAKNNAKAARYLGVSSDWLALGEGDMVPEVTPQAMVIARRLSRITPPKEQRRAAGMLDGLLQQLIDFKGELEPTFQPNPLPTAAPAPAAKKPRAGARHRA